MSTPTSPLPTSVHDEGALATAQEAVDRWRQQPPGAQPDPRFLAALESLAQVLAHEADGDGARAALAEAARGWEERIRRSGALSDHLGLHANLDHQCTLDWQRGDWLEAAARVDLQMACLEDFGESDDPDWLAAKVSSLNRRIALSTALHDPEEALTAARELLDPLQSLTAHDPATYQLQWVDQLRALARRMSLHGDAAEAHVFALEAVIQLREAALREPTVHDESLAEALLELSARYADANRHESAFAAAAEGVALLRSIAPGEGAPQPQLAEALTQLGGCHHELGRLAEAVRLTTESVQLHRALHRLHPFSYGLGLANSLNNLGVYLADEGSAEAACAALEEAIALYQGLLHARRSGVADELARSWRNLGDALSTLGRHPQALAATESALILLRAAATDADSTERLTQCLSELNLRLSALHRHEEALAAVSEALLLWQGQRSRGEGPDPQALACLWNQRAVDLLALGRPACALEAAERAVSLYRRFAAAPDPAEPMGLARSLNNLGLALHSLGRLDAAVDALEEAVSFYYPSRAHPRHEHAFVRHNLSRSLAAVGRQAEAEAQAHCAVELHRLHRSVTPGADAGGLAQALLGLGLRFAQAGAWPASLGAAEEAVALYRAGADPLRRGLIRSLLALGRARAAADPQGAVAAVEEAVALTLDLGPRLPVGDQALRVEALDARHALLTALGRAQEATAAVEAAAILGQRLAAEDPIGWAAAQMDRVGWPPAERGGGAG